LKLLKQMNLPGTSGGITQTPYTDMNIYTDFMSRPGKITEEQKKRDKKIVDDASGKT